jgi:PIN domain nuclease of toxin-antitoxin system
MTFQIVDTHILLLFLQDDSKLPNEVRRLIEQGTVTSAISMASLWEISTKVSLGKLRFDHARNPKFPDMLQENGFQILPIEWSTMQKAAALPWIHRDPFDRLIVAESLLRNAELLSVDSKLDAYGIKRTGH